MEILINGMEMPKSCGVCPLKITNAIKADFSPKNDGSQRVITKLLFTCCLLAKDVTQESNKGEVCDDCPLVALPEHHGRLVDADKCGNVLLDKFTEGLGKWDEFYSAGYRYALKFFSQAPTIVEASNGTDN